MSENKEPNAVEAEESVQPENSLTEEDASSEDESLSWPPAHYKTSKRRKG